MSREIRMVPKDWKHPTNENGKFAPLLGGSFRADEKEWDEGYAHWQSGECESYSERGTKWGPIDAKYASMRFSDYHGSRPSPDDYMPEWTPDQATHLMMYETTSEGTPNLSRVCHTGRAGPLAGRQRRKCICRHDRNLRTVACNVPARLGSKCGIRLENWSRFAKRSCVGGESPSGIRGTAAMIVDDTDPAGWVVTEQVAEAFAWTVAP